MVDLGGVEEGTITFAPCMQLVDRWVLVEERDIAQIILGLLEHDDLRLEGMSRAVPPRSSSPQLLP